VPPASGTGSGASGRSPGTAPGDAPFTPPEAQATLERVQAAVGSSVIGSRPTVRALTIALAIEGHVLVEGVPGIAKTLLARTFARSLGLSFQRVQFTPDLLPFDIVGGVVLDPRDRSFVYRPGPVFAQVVLADEINRAPPKVQSALLEAMQERQVTVDRTSHPLPRPFLVVATQNPLEQEGTYPLPEAELDRFLFRWILGYPSPEEEVTIVRSQLSPVDPADRPPVLSESEIDRLRTAVDLVRVDDGIVRYVAALVAATRADDRLAAGGSPRAAVQFMRAARASALLYGRGFVVPDDVKEMAFPVLNHRLVVRAELRARGHAVDGRGSVEVVRQILKDTVEKVAAPR
jgi:MoxR-like ATPase